jgi:hypothetical protein
MQLEEWQPLAHPKIHVIEATGMDAHHSFAYVWDGIGQFSISQLVNTTMFGEIHTVHGQLQGEDLSRMVQHHAHPGTAGRRH